MFQLFALNCNAPTAVTFAITGLSARGGDTGEHQDGYDLVFHDGSSCRQFIDHRRRLRQRCGLTSAARKASARLVPERSEIRFAARARGVESQ